MGILIGLVAAAKSVWQVALLLFGVGWFVTPLEASLLTIVQTRSADAYRGRVASPLHSVMAAARVLSMALAGVFGDLLGVRHVFVLGGIVIVLGAAMAAALYAGATNVTRGVPADTPGDATATHRSLPPTMDHSPRPGEAD